jgi:DNA-binding transcriptional regulator YiaG
MPHPNRSKRTTDDPARNPTPDQIKQAREAYGMDEAQAAALCYTSEAAWIKWETGIRRMHPFFFEGWCAKAAAMRQQVPA